MSRPQNLYFCMTNVVKYFGPPGTGKTTTLMGIIEKYLDEGTPPEKIAFISFSVKAAEEGKNRAHIRFGLGFLHKPCLLQTHHGYITGHGWQRRNGVLKRVRVYAQ